MKVCAVIPAAGRGTRMGTATPKVLLPISPGITVLDILLDRLEGSADDVHIVVAPGARETMTDHLADGQHENCSVSIQQHPTGMGDAIFGCAGVWRNHDVLLIVWGDQVNLSATTVRACVDAIGAAGPHTGVLPLVKQRHPYVDYVFVDGRLHHIAQSREGDAVRAVGWSDVGLFALRTQDLEAAWRRHVVSFSPGQGTGEINFLPFLAHLAQEEGWNMHHLEVGDPVEARGLNTPEDLTFARRRLSGLHAGLHILCTQAPPPVEGGLSSYLQRVTRDFDLLEPIPVCYSMGKTIGAGREMLSIEVRRFHGWRVVRTSGAPSSPPQDHRWRWAWYLLGYNLRCALAVLGETRRSGSRAVIAVHDWLACPAGILVAVLSRLPVVFHVHSTEMDLYPSWLGYLTRLLENTMAKFARKVIVPSRMLGDYLVARGFPAHKMVVIHHGADDPQLASVRSSLPCGTREQNATTAEKTLLFVGRFRPHKGIHDFLEAVSVLATRYSELRVVLLGADHPRADEKPLNKVITDLGLDKIVWQSPGFLPARQVYEWMQAADVCVLPSRYEPFGLVGIEAMALGTPTILGPGYSPEVSGAEDGACIQLERVDAAEIVEAINAVFTDPGLRTRLRCAGQHHAAGFKWARTAAQTLGLYESVIG